MCFISINYSINAISSIFYVTYVTFFWPGLYSLPLLHAGVTAWLLSPGHLCLFSATSELQDVDMC